MSLTLLLPHTPALARPHTPYPHTTYATQPLLPEQPPLIRILLHHIRCNRPRNAKLRRTPAPKHHPTTPLSRHAAKPPRPHSPTQLRTITTYLSRTVENSLVIQVAYKNGYSLTDLFKPDLGVNERVRTVIRASLDDIGIDPELLASQTLLALYVLLSSSENAQHIHQELASLLWNVLGNPAEGETPPEIYSRAAAMTWAVICGLLSP